MAGHCPSSILLLLTANEQLSAIRFQIHLSVADNPYLTNNYRISLPESIRMQLARFRQSVGTRDVLQVIDGCNRASAVGG